MNKTTIFKTIQLGKKITKTELEKAGFKVSDWANDILEQVEFSKKKESIDLVVLTPSDMGLTGYPTLKEIYGKAFELGYELCPAEVGPLLRMEYRDQPMDEWLRIAMNPINDRDGDPTIFRLGHNADGLGLGRNDGDLGYDWDAGNRFVFRSRKLALSTHVPENSLVPEHLALPQILTINGVKYTRNE